MLKIKSLSFIVIFFVAAFLLAGCTVIFQTGRRSDVQKIGDLERQLAELQRAKSALEKSMAREIANKEVTLQLTERGLVVTFLAEILFDSGKAKIKTEATSSLDKVAKVLKSEVADLNVGVEGHTDNVPIKYSGWKSNWELSTARATSVVHYLAEQKGISPARLAAIGYGEYRPVASNSTAEGRRQNRRVEIIIMPKFIKGAEGSGQAEPVENLK
jgi:chemotaxis protein MotB